MNILYHHRTQAQCAEGVHIREIVKAFEALGHRVFIVSPPGVDIYKDSFSQDVENRNSLLSLGWKFVTRCLPQFLFEIVEIAYNFYALGEIKKVLRKEKIDFIYERNSFFCWAGVRCAKEFGLPIVLEVNEVSGIKRVRGQVFKRIAQRIENDNFTQATGLVVVSNFLKEHIGEKGIDRKKIIVIPNGVNLDDFNPEIPVNKALVSQYKLEGKVVLGFVGSFVKWHNFDFLLECFSELRKTVSHLDPVLLLVGEGPTRSEVCEHAVKIGIGDFVRFTGKVSHQDIHSYINLMDVCVIPHSNEYRSPIKLFEYMAMRKVVVAPDLEPIQSVLTHDINGMIFKKENKESLVRVLEEVIADKQKRERIAGEARRVIEAKYLWKNNALAVLQLIPSRRV
jgi:glycosyltransferase involved in cell wall biosynthesis